MIKYKSEQELELGVKYSRNGIVDFMENYMNFESKDCKTDKKNAKLWEIKTNLPNLQQYMKKGGSKWSKN